MTFQAAERPYQNAVFNEVFFYRGVADIVRPVACQLLRDGRIKGDVHQRGTVAEAADIFRCDKTAARIVALVAEDAVYFQRVPDAFMDLQHHLVGHQHERSLTVGARLGSQQLDCFRACLTSLFKQRRRIEQFPSALISERRASVRTPLLDNISFACNGVHADAAEPNGLPDVGSVGRNHFGFADARFAGSGGLNNL